MGRDSRRFGLAAQDAGADGVKGADGQPARLLAQQELEALLHLSRGLVGKGDRHDLPGRHLVLAHQVGHAVGQYACLAAPRAGQHQHGPFDGLHRLALGGVQIL